MLYSNVIYTFIQSLLLDQNLLFWKELELKVSTYPRLELASSWSYRLMSNVFRVVITLQLIRPNLVIQEHSRRKNIFRNNFVESIFKIKNIFQKHFSINQNHLYFNIWNWFGKHSKPKQIKFSVVKRFPKNVIFQLKKDMIGRIFKWKRRYYLL